MRPNPARLDSGSGWKWLGAWLKAVSALLWHYKVIEALSAVILSAYWCRIKNLIYNQRTPGNVFLYNMGPLMCHYQLYSVATITTKFKIASGSNVGRITVSQVCHCIHVQNQDHCTTPSSLLFDSRAEVLCFLMNHDESCFILTQSNGLFLADAWRVLPPRVWWRSSAQGVLVLMRDSGQEEARITQTGSHDALTSTDS